jgi:hypothetical protein
MRNLPDQVQLLEGDNKLCVNFFNHDSIDILVSVLDQKSTVWVEEFYFSPGNCLVTGENGCHTSEFIIPFYLS